MNATDVYGLLEKHYAPPPSKPPGGRLIKEIQAPHSLRRADALYLPTTTGQRGQIIGHEIKVQRSDVIAELRDPHKADSWLQYCHRWWLVVSDAAMLHGLDVPPEWGVLAPPARSGTRFMQVIQKAPTLHPSPGHHMSAWGTIWARVAHGDNDTQFALQRAQNEARFSATKLREAQEELRRLRTILSGEIETGGARMRGTKVTDILAEIDRLGGYDPGDSEPAWRGAAWRLEPEHVARGILAALQAEDAPDQVASELTGAIARAESALVHMRWGLEALTHKPPAAIPTPAAGFPSAGEAPTSPAL